MEGDWKECAERKIVLEDWDEETVGRLLEWLYSGDYNSPCPRKHASSTATSHADTQGAQDEHDIIPAALAIAREAIGSPDFMLGLESGPNANTKAVLDGDHRLQPLIDLADQLFNGVRYKPQTSSSEYFGIWSANTEHPPQYLDFEATFFAHAKVYALADYMLLPDLQAVAFQHLKRIFLWIDSRIAKSAAVPNLITLIEYVFANTHRPKSGKEPLRELIAILIATNFCNFKEVDIRGLMNIGGIFVIDVCQQRNKYWKRG